MRKVQAVLTLLQLASDEERRFAARLTTEERAASGTLEQPSPKDVLAHVAGAKECMRVALVAAREGGDPDDSHDRETLFHANCSRRFEEVERDANRLAQDLVTEVERLDAVALESAPPWISERTLGEEIIMYGTTHSLTHLFDPLCARGDVAESVRAQERLVEALRDDASPHVRAGALFNLGCLYVRTGRECEALTLVREAVTLEPGLADLARSDPDLEPLRAKLP